MNDLPGTGYLMGVRAYASGRQAGIEGRPKSDNPYEEENVGWDMWLLGWERSQSNLEEYVCEIRRSVEGRAD